MNYSYSIIETSCNTIIIADKAKNTAIIDPGDDSDIIIAEIKKQKCSPKMILLTHGHYDHVGAAETIKRTYKLPIICHKEEAEYLSDPEKNYSVEEGPRISIREDKTFEDGDIIDLGNLKIKAIHSPGHSKGSSCFFVDDKDIPILFSGDTLFFEARGRTDLCGGNEDALINSIKKLFLLPDKTIVIPGHGPKTTIGQEKNA